MAIVGFYGKPDLFATITCNPKGPEIVENLAGQNASDRPDIVARVFNLKLNEIMDDIIQNEIFGKVVYYVYTIEYQKRGLPHCHLVIKIASPNSPSAANHYDKFVSAEIPDKDQNPLLHKAVTRHMIHGPCGFPSAPCYDKDAKFKCKKCFPKSISNETKTDKLGFPVMMRRKDGQSTTRNGIELNNQYVVPYNPFLLYKYDCHINVEICSSV